MRPTDRSRIAYPLVLSAGLFGLFVFFQANELRFRGADIRYEVFGPDLRWLRFAAWVPLIFGAVRGLDFLLFDLTMSRRRNVVAPQLLREILSIALYFILFAVAAGKILEYHVGAFLTTTTVLAAVIGLALQETLGNLFSGIALHMEGSYEVGDVLHSGDFIGVVEGVNWRATRLRGFNNQLVILPNSMIARERLEIFPQFNFNARILTVGVDYHVPPAQVIDILTQAASHVEGVAREKPCFARVGSFGDSAVIFEVKYFTRDYAARDRIDADVRKAIWYALRRNDISFATPIRAYAPYTPPKSDSSLTEEAIVARLDEVAILMPLSNEAHRRIAAATKVHSYSKGEAILSRGATGDSMFVVHSGSVSVRISDEKSASGWTEVARLEEGEFFGEMALLTGEARAADVVAVSDVTALEIGKESLQPILLDHPELAAAISARVIERRGRLETFHVNAADDDERTVLSRIRAYFGL